MSFWVNNNNNKKKQRLWLMCPMDFAAITDVVVVFLFTFLFVLLVGVSVTFFGWSFIYLKEKT